MRDALMTENNHRPKCCVTCGLISAYRPRKIRDACRNDICLDDTFSLFIKVHVAVFFGRAACKIFIFGRDSSIRNELFGISTSSNVFLKKLSEIEWRLFLVSCPDPFFMQILCVIG